MRWLSSAIGRLISHLQGDPVIDGLIRPPIDRGFGKHDEAKEREARKRLEEAQALALDAARARLPRRLVFLDERRFGGRRS